MKIPLIVFVCLVFNCVGFAQTVEVQYDVVSQTINVVNVKKSKDTLHTKEIRLKPGSIVKFKLVNFNTEALELERISKKAVLVDTTLLANNQKSVLSFFQNKFVAPSLGSEFTSILESLTKSKGQKISPTSSSKLPISQDELSNLVSYNTDELRTVINARLNAMSKVSNALIELKRLRVEVNLPESKIKESASSTIDFLDPETKRLFLAEKKQMEVYKRLNQLASENVFLLESSTNLLGESIKKDTLNKSRGENTSLYNRILVKDYLSLKKASDAVKEESVQTQLYSLYDDYRKIIEKKYVYDFSTVADMNNDLLNFNFYRVNSLDTNTKKKELIKTETFKFKMQDLRLVNSAGVLFVKYNTNPETYSINNGKIVATETDKITPVIATFLNVNSSSEAPIKIGGSFGIGIGVNESKSVHFMIGPNLTIGRTNLLNIHAGIVTSRLSRLGQGYKVGDALAGTDIPKINRYEFGTYFGISFNLSSITSKK